MNMEVYSKRIDSFKSDLLLLNKKISIVSYSRFFCLLLSIAGVYLGYKEGYVIYYLWGLTSFIGFIFLIKKHWNYTMKGVLLGHEHLHAYIDRKYVLYSEDIILNIINKKSKCISYVQ